MSILHYKRKLQFFINFYFKEKQLVVYWMKVFKVDNYK